tara:strand:+ start:931 stop:1584 length:654 start_codon:yes stop_codon:yes gene_type:complete
LIKNKKAFIIDLDGTIVDSLQDLIISVNLTLAELGYPTKNENFIKNAIGDGARTLLKVCLPNHRLPDKHTYELFMKHYHSNSLKKTKLYPGVMDFLENTIYIKKAILTNKPIAPAKKIISALGINKFFEFIYGCDSFPHPKPHPIGLKSIMKSFNIRVSQAIMIGDSFQDIRVANSIGMDSIAITNGIGEKTALLLEKPTYTVKNFEDILPMLSITS